MTKIEKPASIQIEGLNLFKLVPEEREIIVLALAVLSLRSPGFGFAGRKIAAKLDGGAKEYDDLRLMRTEEDSAIGDTVRNAANQGRRQKIADLIVRLRLWANEVSEKTGREYRRDALLVAANEAERIAKECWFGFDAEKDRRS